MKTIAFILIIGVFWSCGNTPKNQDLIEGSAEPFSLMSFNVLYSTSVESTIKTISEANADIVGLQEASEQRIHEAADSLGFYSHSFDKTSGNLSNNDTGILSRYLIKDTLEDGVLIELPGGQIIAVFSVHLSPYPYEPYDIRDEKVKTAGEAIYSAVQTRMPEINPVLAVIDSLIKSGMPVFLTGDFNEPSHLDWTEAAAENNMHFSMAIDWPVSSAVVETGLKDAFREVHPDELNKNGITWTTNKSENEVYDRIDFIYHNLQGKWKTKSASRVGRIDNEGLVKIPGYESDHFGVLINYSLTK
jgi:endonuclease/exonuclease/phosphatase family metal-dependent hydrolase